MEVLGDNAMRPIMGDCSQCVYYLLNRAGPDGRIQYSQASQSEQCNNRWRATCMRYPKHEERHSGDTCGEFKPIPETKEETIGKPLRKYLPHGDPVIEDDCGHCRHFILTNHHSVGDCTVAATRTTEYDCTCDDYEKPETEHITE